MADGIPDRLPRNVSQGETRVFDILKRLHDDCLFYYEPIVNNQHPDFVVLLPSLGLLVIEVKGWRVNEIVSGDHDDVSVIYNREVRKKRHPMRQAREYMFTIKDTCEANPALRPLTHPSGKYRGGFIFP